MTNNKRDIQAIRDWLTANKKTDAWLVRKTKMSATRVSQTLAGTYTGNVEELITRANAAIDAYEQRGGDEKPIAETSVYKLVWGAIDYARAFGNIAVVSGSVGTGKTTAIREYAAANANTYMIGAAPQMQPSTLLETLIAQTGATVSGRTGYSRGSMSDRFNAIVTKLRGVNAVIVLDEADKTQPPTLEYLRRIRDEAGIGIVLSGTELLTSLISPHRGRFDQIRSRVGLWPEVVKCISRDDSDLIARVLLEKHNIEPDAPTLDTLWQYAGGSARVIGELLIPAVIVFGVKQGKPLSPQLIHSVAASVLNLKKCQ